MRRITERMIVGAVFAVCGAAAAYEVKLDVSPGRVRTPLKVDMERIGTLRPSSVGEIRGSDWTTDAEG